MSESVVVSKFQSIPEALAMGRSDADDKYVSESMSYCNGFMLEYCDVENIPYTLAFLNEYQRAFISDFLSRFRYHPIGIEAIEDRSSNP